MTEIRKIIHVDMDAFYASIEQRDFPELLGKPVVVGRDMQRGVIAAASYEARQFGVHSAMPSVVARRKCPQLIFQPARFSVYGEVSQQIMNIFRDYTDLVEPLSLDEAFLDLTENRKQEPFAIVLAKEIKQRIKKETALTASVGISYNKFLAKVASDYQKPDGLFVIRPERAQEFIDQLPIRKFFGVGKVTLKKMTAIGIHNGKELRALSEWELQNQFGKLGRFLFHISRGHDLRHVESRRERSSFGAETTLQQDLLSMGEWRPVLDKIIDRLMRHYLDNNIFGKTLVLKVKFSDFQQITRSLTLPSFIKTKEHVFQGLEQIMRSLQLKKSVRLLGISITNLMKKDNQINNQLTLFEEVNEVNEVDES